MANHPNRSPKLYSFRVRGTSDGRFWVEQRVYDFKTGKRCWNALERCETQARARELKDLYEKKPSA